MELFNKVSWGGLLGPPPWELGLRVVQQYLSGGPVPDPFLGVSGTSMQNFTSLSKEKIDLLELNSQNMPIFAPRGPSRAK